MLDRAIKLQCAGRLVALRLRGVIYHGADHFTSRTITSRGVMWFHDGITTHSTSVRHGTLQDLPSGKDLHFSNGRKAVAAIYAVH
ncbi:hypothetical protein FB451DRAFT_1020317 [Mycena latifolia]|nr:hypothetical protein FB451DRAFT_1020317 [Mycena latifolia]